MNQLITKEQNGDPTMGSLEISQLCEKEHRNVMANIRTMCEALNIHSADFSAQYKDSRGRTLPCFNLPRRECLILAAKISPSLIYKVLGWWKGSTVPSQIVVCQKLLKSLIHYNPNTGIFTRRVTTNSHAITGAKAGSLQTGSSGKAYLSFNVIGHCNKAHRWAFLYMEGRVPDQIDHINGNGCDNAWINLRECTNIENCQNQRQRKNNKSGVTGVHWHKASRQWAVQINVNGRRVYLGYRKTIEAASQLRLSAQEAAGYAKNHGLPRPLFSPSQIAGKWAIHNIQGAA